MAPFFPRRDSPYAFWNDPLDKIFTIFCIVMVVAMITGYALYFFLLVAILLALGKVFAKNKEFFTAEAISKDVDLTGKVAMITGCTSGIGEETARVLALRGAHVIMVSRNVKKLQESRMRLETVLAEKGVKGKFSTIQCDLGDLKSVDKCVNEFLEMKLPLNILINNAGLMALQKRETTAQDFEKQVGVNHIGHFRLTTLLTNKLVESQPSRVVCLSSSAHRFANLRFLLSEYLETQPYEAWRAYGNSKMCNLMFAKEFNTRYSSKGVTAVSCNPGGIFTGLQGSVETWIMLKWLIASPFFFKTIQQGAATSVFCATDPSVTAYGGGYFDNCKATMAKIQPSNEDCNKLWNITVRLFSKGQ